MNPKFSHDFIVFENVIFIEEIVKRKMIVFSPGLDLSPVIPSILYWLRPVSAIPKAPLRREYPIDGKDIHVPLSSFELATAKRGVVVSSDFTLVNSVGGVERSAPLIAFFFVFHVSSLGPMVIGVLKMTIVRVHVEEI